MGLLVPKSASFTAPVLERSTLPPCFVFKRPRFFAISLVLLCVVAVVVEVVVVVAVVVAGSYVVGTPLCLAK